MSFLFGKKNKGNPNALPPATRDTHTSSGSGSTSTANGVLKEKPTNGLGPAPGGVSGNSVNNSANSIGGANNIGGANTPSPEHGIGQRGGPVQEPQVSFSMPLKAPTII